MVTDFHTRKYRYERTPLMMAKCLLDNSWSFTDPVVCSTVLIQENWRTELVGKYLDQAMGIAFEIAVRELNRCQAELIAEAAQ